MTGLDRKANELMAELRKLTDRFMSWQDDLVHEKLGELNRRDVSVIYFLGEDGECMMSELAQKIRLTVSSATLIIEKLVEKGLVARHRSMEDRRVVRVALTAEGQALHQAMSATILRLGRAMLESLDESEQDLFLTLYRKITAAMPPR